MTAAHLLFIGNFSDSEAHGWRHVNISIDELLVDGVRLHHKAHWEVNFLLSLTFQAKCFLVNHSDSALQLSKVRFTKNGVVRCLDHASVVQSKQLDQGEVEVDTLSVVVVH